MSCVETWISFTETGWFRPVAALLIFFLFLCLRGALTRLTLGLLSKLAVPSKREIDSAFLLALESPLKSFILILGLYFALTILPLPLPWRSHLIVLFRIIVVIFVAWALYNLAESRLIRAIGRRMGFDSLLNDFLIKAIKAAVAALAVIIVVQQLGYDVNGFIAGLGLGGLAVALAAKDALANILAGIVIIADKPFSVGDWIATPEVEGTVEEVSFRSTKIRTFAQALVTVPNALLADQAVTNWSRMGKRRVSFKLKVALFTPSERLERSVLKIREVLESDPAVHPETILVHWENFGESSLEIVLYFFTHTTAYAEHLAVKEALNFKIKEILEEEGVALALPARALRFDSPDK